jgi:hypothetical protein
MLALFCNKHVELLIELLILLSSFSLLFVPGSSYCKVVVTVILFISVIISLILRRYCKIAVRKNYSIVCSGLFVAGIYYLVSIGATAVAITVTIIGFLHMAVIVTTKMRDLIH